MPGKKKLNLQDLGNDFHADFKAVKDAQALEALKVKYLGRKDGKLTNILRSLKDMPEVKRREVGPKANALRDEFEKALKEKLAGFVSKPALSDLTIPGKKIPIGHLHPLSIIEAKVREIFRSLNFSVVEGPEVESEYYNFDALNIPANHPARDMWDTFWLQSSQNQISNIKDQSLGKQLLRTHTSPVQIRYMETHQPPFQIIVPGRVFRYEATDASHEINFYQVEGLMVGENINLANFKYVIEQFFHRFFGQSVAVRLRPSYFPFVEPGLEVDINWKGKWLEVMGAGMVHPNVLRAVKYDPAKVQGFAFGLGLERLAMIKYNIPDIRLFYSGDLRFIKQF